MITQFLTKLLGGTKSEREVRRLSGFVTAINEQFDLLQNTTQADLIAKTRAWQQRIATEREALKTQLDSQGLTAKEI
ncbi:MAG: hypothetical protein COY19_11295, partial [Candidatus Marinimicrobia bacterium CG_4_10_14_0_2_um_filter_48_9]